MTRRFFFPILLAGFTFVCGSAEAADFRALDFNASCADLAAKEAALGSAAFDEQLPSGFQYAFRNREMDRDVVVAYACRDGRFFRGAYIFSVRDAADATALYGALKRRTIKERGAPSFDFASAEYRRKMQAVGATLSPVDTQVAFWNGPRSEAHASVAAPSGQRGWRVSLSFTSEDGSK
jgi:glucan biosynthesis protein